MKNLTLFLFIFFSINICLYSQEETPPKTEAELRWDEMSTQLETAFYAGDYLQAVEYGEQAYDWAVQNFDEDHLLIANSLDNLGTVLHHAGKLQEAVPYLEMALLKAEQQLGKEHLDWLSRANNLAMLYKDLGFYQKAIPLFTESLEIIHRVYGKEHQYYGIFLNNQGLVYEAMNLFDRAIRNHEEALLLTEQEFGKNHRKYAIRLGNLSSAYMSIGQLEKALDFARESVRITGETLGLRHPSYANGLRHNANVLSELGQEDQAVSLLEEAISIVEEKLGTEHVEYLVVCHSLAISYSRLGFQDKALANYIKVLEGNEKIRGKNHEQTLSFHNSLLAQLDMMGKYDACIELSKKSLLAQKNISNQRSYFSETAQLAMVGESKSLFNHLQSFVHRHPEEYEINDLLYNDKLFLSGISLRNTEQMLKTIRNNSDSQMTMLFEEWESLKKTMAKQYSLPIADRTPQFDSLEIRCDELESNLARESAEFRTFQQEIHWQDVRNQLDDGEIAIEFVHYNYLEKGQPTDSIFYVAYLLKKDSKKVKRIPLFEEEELGNLNRLRSLYAFETTGNLNLKTLIIDPIIHELEGIHTIYYASSGLLHRINLQAIPFSENNILAERFEMHKLSSTRQLTTRGGIHQNTTEKAVLYGGIVYESSFVDIEVNDIPGESIGSAFRSLRKGDWGYLEWTNKEVESIGNTLGSANFEVIQKQGNEATEGHFKRITAKGHSPRVLHFATHAYFFPDTESEAYDVNAFEASKHPMIRSGLILAGANSAWRGEAAVGMEDGILTAYEIAQMDLSNTELVVLSACDTGLGDIDDSEGVFGLQRAFKMAGVKYVVMSLWSVKDKQTQEFMSDFYRIWLDDDDEKNIPQAFQQAQLNLHHRYAKPFNPFLWASFILME